MRGLEFVTHLDREAPRFPGQSMDHGLGTHVDLFDN